MEFCRAKSATKRMMDGVRPQPRGVLAVSVPPPGDLHTLFSFQSAGERESEKGNCVFL